MRLAGAAPVVSARQLRAAAVPAAAKQLLPQLQTSVQPLLPQGLQSRGGGGVPSGRGPGPGLLRPALAVPPQQVRVLAPGRRRVPPPEGSEALPPEPAQTVPLASPRVGAPALPERRRPLTAAGERAAQVVASAQSAHNAEVPLAGQAGSRAPQTSPQPAAQRLPEPQVRRASE